MCGQIGTDGESAFRINTISPYIAYPCHFFGGTVDIHNHEAPVFKVAEVGIQFVGIPGCCVQLALFPELGLGKGWSGWGGLEFGVQPFPFIHQGKKGGGKLRDIMIVDGWVG